MIIADVSVAALMLPLRPDVYVRRAVCACRFPTSFFFFALLLLILGAFPPLNYVQALPHAQLDGHAFLLPPLCFLIFSPLLSHVLGRTMPHEGRFCSFSLFSHAFFPPSSDHYVQIYLVLPVSGLPCSLWMFAVDLRLEFFFSSFALCAIFHYRSSL
uniref:Uncharacterized protein TCIL3000_8_1700 n=1 Tax=Trypanosoma congolense (strain IL3000) TaxID=1068625 RepID=G0URD9_TRYCI|nr:unnamed protein product [Trypanosoma congolense IL3000]